MFPSVPCSSLVLSFIPSVVFPSELATRRSFKPFRASLPPCLSCCLCSHRARSVQLIRYSEHIWTALTGINHKQFEVHMLASSGCQWKGGKALKEPMHKIPLFYSTSSFMPDLLLFTLPHRVSTSAPTGCPILLPSLLFVPFMLIQLQMC